MADEKIEIDLSTLTSTLNQSIEKLGDNLEKSFASSITQLSSAISDQIKSLNKITSSRPSSTESAKPKVNNSTATATPEVSAKMKELTDNISVASKEYELSTSELRRLRETQRITNFALSGFNAPILSSINKFLMTNQLLNAEIDVIKKSLAVKQSILAKEQQSVTEKNDVIQKEIDARNTSITAIQSEVDAAKNSLLEIDSKKQLIIANNAELDAIESSIASKQAENAVTQEKMQANAELTGYLQSQIAIAQQELSSSEDALGILQQKKEASKSEISAINEQIRQLQSRGEFQGRGMNPEQRAAFAQANAEQVEALKKQKDNLLSSFEATKQSIVAERERRDALRSSIAGMETELSPALAEQTLYEQSLASNIDAIDADATRRWELIEEIDSAAKRIAELGDSTGEYQEIITKGESELAKLNKENEKYLKQQKKNTDSLEKHQKAVDEKTEELKQKEYEKLVTNLKNFGNILMTIAGELNKLVDSIRKTQQRFGITAGEAAGLKFKNLVSSVDSFATTLFTLGKTAPVSMAEIEDAQAAFQSQFGGIISSDAARGIAEQAKELGVTAEQLAQARRVFLTQTGGNVAEAAEQQKSFIATFEQGGMTQKDAMQFIANNSNLLAKNGTRFQQSLARAAAEAKRIGVDLGKVDQFGDNVIGNYEGFLESMANLGAMGFGFDSNRLAEIAESGDTGALMSELQTQLQMQGKNLNDLTRSQRLELESAFGMSIEEMQRLAGGDEIVDPALAESKETNSILGNILKKFEEWTGFDINGIIEKYGGPLTNIAEAFGGIIAGGFKLVGWAVHMGYMASMAFNLKAMAAKLGAGTGGIFSRIFGKKDKGSSTGTPGLPGSTPSPGTPGGGGAPSAGGGRSVLGNLIGDLKPSQLLAAGAAMVLVAGAMYIMAKAFQQFSKDVTPGGVAAAVVAMGTLTLAALAISKIKGPVIVGAFAIGILGGALWVAAKAMQQFSDGVNWNGVLMGITTLGALALAAAGLSFISGPIIVGAAAMVIMGGALWVIGKGLQQFTALDWKTVGIAISMIGGLATVAGLMGTFAIPIMIGSAAMVVLAGAIWILGKAMGSLEQLAPLIETVFSGIANIVQNVFAGAVSVIDAGVAAFERFSASIGSLNDIDYLAIIAGLTGIAAAMGIGTGVGIVSGIASFFTGGDPLDKLNKRLSALARNVTGVNSITQAINALVVSLNNLSTTVGNIDAGQLQQVVSTVANQSNNGGFMATVGSAGRSLVDVGRSALGGAMNFGRRLLGREVPSDTTPSPAVRVASPTTSTVTNASATNAATREASTATSPAVNVNVDLAKLEQKLDAVVRAISMMEVRLDGNRVGAIIAGNDQRAGIDGVFRAQRL
jgi:hypothetical protein